MRLIVLFLFVGVFGVVLLLVLSSNKRVVETPTKTATNIFRHPLSIDGMRLKPYPGSEIVIEQELPAGSNYKQYITSYKSDGLKINGLLTVPETLKPENGYPVIIFNHGYIPPAEYRTNERYIAYVDTFARNGYVVFKSDYRGHGFSEGDAEGAYFSPGYTADVLNALESVKKLEYVNPDKIGMWGHSMGGTITQRALVINPDIKAAVIWGGVVGSYEDIYREWWSKRRQPNPTNPAMNSNRSTRQSFIDDYGEPNLASPFWNSISATSYLSLQKAPVSLHHGYSDETVPYQLSQLYYNALKKAGIESEIFFYEGNDHNISQSFNLAIDRSVNFFDKYLK